MVKCTCGKVLTLKNRTYDPNKKVLLSQELYCNKCLKVFKVTINQEPPAPVIEPVEPLNTVEEIGTIIADEPEPEAEVDIEEIE